MTHTLLAIAVGPVQDFIAAARKTRDLWFGSFVLSEISKAVARHLAERFRQAPEGDALAPLIFPAPREISELEPTESGRREEALNVANVIVTEVPESLSSDMEKLVEGAAVAASTRWKEFAEEIFQPGGIRRSDIDESLWNEQVNGFVETYAAWVRHEPQTMDYASARRRLGQLLAARKQTREFVQSVGRSKVPKSSLDGARESLTHDLDDSARARLRLRGNSIEADGSARSRFGGEQLDCVGLTKRFAGGRQHFPSVTRVAADSWIRGMESRCPDRFRKLIQHAEEGCRLNLVHRVAAERDQSSPFAAFPFEGDYLFKSRIGPVLLEASGKRKQPPPDATAWGARLQGTLRDIIKDPNCAGEPDPYVAVLMADGDAVGKALSSMESADEHRRFSKSLARFAGDAGAIVREHQGVLIYSGGDDVLALLPVDRCVPCARKLHDAFGSLMEAAVRKLNDERKAQDPAAEELKHIPTLSVGIAIGHMFEPMEYLREWAREAEKRAKNKEDESTKGDGLAIHVQPRGGAPFTVREQWRNAGREPIDGRLNLWVDLILRDQLSHRGAYELRELALTFKNWNVGGLSDAVNKGALHVLARKEGNRAGAKVEIRKLLAGVTTPEQLTEVAHELLVARRIAAAAKFDPDGFRQAARLEEQPADGAAPGGPSLASDTASVASLGRAAVEAAAVDSSGAGKETP